MSSQRLQKVLAQAGIASRRAAERLITEGRVRVNGRIVRELGARANPHKDRVEVDGRRLVAQRHVYFLMHKPRGVVTTLDDPEGRKTVKDLLRNIHERVFPVGRLDFQTSGALLLTNDGDLAQALLHPTRAVPKTYNAKLQGELDEARLEALRSGVVLDDGKKTAPAEVSILRKDDKSTSIQITIAEGKNRQIHRMGEAIARTVLRLTRISFAGLTLDKLRPGEIRPLSALEVAELKQAYQHKPKRRRPFQAYGEMELDEPTQLFAVDSELDDSEQDDETWEEPVAQENRSPAAHGPRGTRGAFGKRDSREQRERVTDERGKRDARMTQDARGAKRGKRDGRTTQDARGPKRDPYAARNDRTLRGKRDPREPAKFDARGKRDPREPNPVKHDVRGKRDPREPAKYSRGDRSKRDPREADAKPHKYQAARTQPTKGPRSRPTKGKRTGSARRKTTFKR